MRIVRRNESHGYLSGIGYSDTEKVEVIISLSLSFSLSLSLSFRLGALLPLSSLSLSLSEQTPAELWIHPVVHWMTDQSILVQVVEWVNNYVRTMSPPFALSPCCLLPVALSVGCVGPIKQRERKRLFRPFLSFHQSQRARLSNPKINCNNSSYPTFYTLNTASSTLNT